MKVSVPIILLVFLCFSCMNKSEKLKKEAKQTVEAQKYKMYTQFFAKLGNDGTDDSELVFQTKLLLLKEQFEQNKNLSLELQYGVDSAFLLLAQNDTIWPIYVMPVANGQLLNPQFIVAFDKSKLKGSEIEFRAAIKSLTTNNDSGILFNLTKINSLHK